MASNDEGAAFREFDLVKQKRKPMRNHTSEWNYAIVVQVQVHQDPKDNKIKIRRFRAFGRDTSEKIDKKENSWKAQSSFNHVKSAEDIELPDKDEAFEVMKREAKALQDVADEAKALPDKGNEPEFKNNHDRGWAFYTQLAESHVDPERSIDDNECSTFLEAAALEEHAAFLGRLIRDPKVSDKKSDAFSMHSADHYTGLTEENFDELDDPDNDFRKKCKHRALMTRSTKQESKTVAEVDHVIEVQMISRAITHLERMVLIEKGEKHPIRFSTHNLSYIYSMVNDVRNLNVTTWRINGAKGSMIKAFLQYIDSTEPKSFGQLVIDRGSRTYDYQIFLHGMVPMKEGDEEAYEKANAPLGIEGTVREKLRKRMGEVLDTYFFDALFEPYMTMTDYHPDFTARKALYAVLCQYFKHLFPPDDDSDANVEADRVTSTEGR
jgi:hypothetical protein